MGNPHAVIFVDDADEDLQALATTLRPGARGRADTFPRRTNVEFARVRGEEIDLVVWERGCGITLACGTGACATVVAACRRGAPRRAAARSSSTFPAARSCITVAPDDSGVRMRGPARIVFRGTLDEAQLARVR